MNIYCYGCFPAIAEHVSDTYKLNSIIMKKRNVKLTQILIAALMIFVAACQTKAPVTDQPAAGSIAVMVAEGFHDGEAYMPIGYLLNQGYDITVIGPDRGKVKAYNSNFTINIEKSVSEVAPDDFDALILPGGKGPAVLREDDRVIEFVKAFWKTGKVTAAICHGPQVLVTADLIKGFTSSGTGSIKEEIEGAGAVYVDSTVVVDRNLITSRNPQDLNNFSTAIVEALKKQK